MLIEDCCYFLLPLSAVLVRIL